MLIIDRTEDAATVYLKLFDENDTTRWNCHRISCAVAEIAHGPLFHKPGRVRIDALSFSDGTPDELRAYARQLLAVADIAQALQEEMRARYEAQYGATRGERL